MYRILTPTTRFATTSLSRFTPQSNRLSKLIYGAKLYYTVPEKGFVSVVVNFYRKSETFPYNIVADPFRVCINVSYVLGPFVNK